MKISHLFFWQYVVECHRDICRWVASPQPPFTVGFPPASGGFRTGYYKLCVGRSRGSECSSSMSLSGRGLMRHSGIHLGPFEYCSTGLSYLCRQTEQNASSNICLFFVKVVWPFVLFFLFTQFLLVLCRLSTFGFVVFSAIFQSEFNRFCHVYQILIGFLAVPISNCFRSLKALAVLFVFAMSSTSLLFYFRARAVFLSNPWAVAFFGILWLGVVGGSLTTIPAFVGVNLGPTRRCLTGVIKFYSVACTIAPLINDTIVFLAISWRLCYINIGARPTVRNGVRMAIFGDHLPVFSKSLLQDGQIYFLSVFFIIISFY